MTGINTGSMRGFHEEAHRIAADAQFVICFLAVLKPTRYNIKGRARADQNRDLGLICPNPCP